MNSKYDPQDLSELMTYCEIIIKSQLCPQHINTPADAMLIIQRGAELGLSAVSALQNLNVLHGKVTMPAALAVGVAKASDACEYFTCLETTDQKSTWETKRRGTPEPTTYTFTMQDARTAGLGGTTWKKYPRNMLAARASMNLARMEYQDVLAGVYSHEEMESVDGESDTVPDVPESDPAPGRLKGKDDHLADLRSLIECAVEVDERGPVISAICERMEVDGLTDLSAKQIKAIIERIEEKPGGDERTEYLLGIARPEPEDDGQDADADQASITV